MANLTPHQQKTLLIANGIAKLCANYGLPDSTEAYMDLLMDEFPKRGWTTGEFNFAIDCLMTDEEYAKNAQFGRYPSIADFERMRKLITNAREIEFKTHLSTWLDGGWWYQDVLFEFCNNEERGAITNAGGISDLYRRANSENYPVAIPKLIEEVLTALRDIKSGERAIQTAERTGYALPIGETLKQIVGSTRKSAMQIENKTEETNGTKFI